MDSIQDIVNALLKKSGEEVAKAYTLSATLVAASVVELDWVQTLALYGNDETPLISRIGRTKSQAVTHRWREATARAAASNTSSENAAAKSAVTVNPGAKTNTCQILKGTIGVSGSAVQEAQNGIYGTDALNMVALQLEMETKGILKDIEYSALFGVEATTEPRQMKGLVGLVGTWNGWIQTTRTDGSDAAFDQTMFEGFLEDIYTEGTGLYPNRLYCSIAAASKINTFTSAYRLNIDAADAEALAAAMAGMKVKYYIAPWGGIVEIVPHPLCENDATSANNWMMAVNENLLALADFRALRTESLPKTTDAELWEVLYEGTLEAKIESAHGILRNFDQL